MRSAVARWWTKTQRRVFVAWLLLGVFLFPAAGAAERPAFGLGGVGLEVGVASPEHADLAPQFGGVVHLGSMFKPWLHLTAGVSYWSANIDRSTLGSAASGTISDLAFRSDLRWEPGNLFGAYPYVVTGLVAHHLSADIPDDHSIEQALSGLNWGFDAGIGVMSAARDFRYGFELRRRYVNDVDNWTATASVGWFFPRTSRTRIDRAPAPPYDYRADRHVAHGTVQAAPAAGGSAAELTKLKDLLRDLVQVTRAQRAEVDSLRRKLDTLAQHTQPARPAQPAATIARAPAAPSDPAPSTTAAPDSRLEGLRQALGRAAELTGDPAELRGTGDGLLLVLPGTLLFDTASSFLQVESRETLRRIALVLLRFPDVSLRIEGHADSRGDPAFNLQLSRERAAAVARELAEQGIDSRRLTAVGIGTTAPIADNETAAGRALNRRVELRFRFESTTRDDAGSVR